MGKFTDMFVNSPLHIILAGRAGYEYDYFEDDAGKKELEKTGIKMKAEGEMGYEPDLLVHMERRQLIEGNSVAKTWREASVLKDRSTMLDGNVASFDSVDGVGKRLPLDFLVKQTWAAFAPHIKCLNLGGRQLGVDTSRTSDSLIKIEKRDWAPVQRKIVLGEIADLLTMHCPGQTKEDKQRRITLLRTHFSAGYTEIEETFDLLTLRAGYDALHRDLEKRPSRYAAAMEAESAPLELNDDIPAHSKAPVKDPCRATPRSRRLRKWQGRRRREDQPLSPPFFPRTN